MLFASRRHGSLETLSRSIRFIVRHFANLQFERRSVSFFAFKSVHQNCIPKGKDPCCIFQVVASSHRMKNLTLLPSPIIERGSFATIRCISLLRMASQRVVGLQTKRGMESATHAVVVENSMESSQTRKQTSTYTKRISSSNDVSHAQDVVRNRSWANWPSVDFFSEVRGWLSCKARNFGTTSNEPGSKQNVPEGRKQTQSVGSVFATTKRPRVSSSNVRRRNVAIQSLGMLEDILDVRDCHLLCQTRLDHAPTNDEHSIPVEKHQFRLVLNTKGKCSFERGPQFAFVFSKPLLVLHQRMMRDFQF